MIVEMDTVHPPHMLYLNDLIPRPASLGTCHVCGRAADSLCFTEPYQTGLRTECAHCHFNAPHDTKQYQVNFYGPNVNEGGGPFFAHTPEAAALNRARSRGKYYINVDTPHTRLRYEAWEYGDSKNKATGTVQLTRIRPGVYGLANGSLEAFL